jgi:hypothetical protein
MTGLGRRFQQTRQPVDSIRETSFDIFTSTLCKHWEHDLVAVVLAERDGNIQVNEARRWLSAVIAQGQM